MLTTFAASAAVTGGDPNRRPYQAKALGWSLTGIPAYRSRATVRLYSGQTAQPHLSAREWLTSNAAFADFRLQLAGVVTLTSLVRDRSDHSAPHLPNTFGLDDR